VRRLAFVAVMAACGQPAAIPVTPIAVAPPLANTPAPAPKVVAAPAVDAVLAWPVAPFTKLQTAEVKSCDIDKLAKARYPKSVSVDALAGAFARHGTCDDATFAAACAARLPEDAAVPPACLDAYRSVIKTNPAFAFATSLLGGYFGKLAQVAPPPIAGRALTGVVLAYKWGGLGTAVEWNVTAHDLTTKPTLQIAGANTKPVTWSDAIGTDVTALGHSLASFMPIPKTVHAVDCTDNYPDWTATLTFDDGAKLELATQGSNLLGLGGPWQMTLGGITYLQISPDLAQAIYTLVKALGLPIGEPQGEFCHGYDLGAEVLAP
jgi:hypothetical protein